MVDGNALLFVAVALIPVLAELAIVFFVISIPSKKLDPAWIANFIDYGSTALVVSDIQLDCSLFVFKGIHLVPPSVSFGTDFRYHPQFSGYQIH
jgi:hypothetical protein